MSRFDDWAKSSAQGGGLFRSFRKTKAAAANADSEGVSRRDLMKKGALVTGAAVVGSSLIQSVTSPAFAVSGSCTPSDPSGCGGTCTSRCAAGKVCATAIDCQAGLVCNAGVCATPLPQGAANGASCTGTDQASRDASCASGYCNGNNANAKCAAAPTGTVALGGACHASTQTTANAECSQTGGTAICATTSTPGTATTNGVCRGAVGTVCGTNADCLAGSCAKTTPSATNKTCQPV